MSFNAGAIESTLTLDRTPFQAGAREARREAERLGRLSPNIRVNVNREQALNDLRAIQRQAERLSRQSLNLSGGLNPAQFDRTYRRIQRQLTQLNNRTVRPKVGLDITEFERNRNRVSQRLTQLGRRRVDPRVGLNTQEFDRNYRRVHRQLTQLGRRNVSPSVDVNPINRLSNSLQGAAGSAGGLMSALLVLAPAAIPVLAATTGAVLSLGAALGTAGIAAGVFGLAAFNQVSKVKDAYKNLTKAQEAYKNATTKEGRQKALEAQKQALEGLNKRQRETVTMMGKVKQAWSSFGNTAQKPILDTFNSGMRIVVNLLKAFEPAVKPIAQVFKGMFGEIEKGTKSPGMKKFVDFIATQGPPAIRLLWQSFRNLAMGLANLFGAFSGKEAGNVLIWINNVTARFLAWTRSESFKQFITYVKTMMPVVANMIRQVAWAVWSVIRALAPVGAVIIAALTPVAKAVGDISTRFPWLVQGIWAVMAAMRLFAIGMAGVMAVLRVVSIAWRIFGGAIKAVMWIVKAIRIAWIALQFAFAASPIGVIILAIVALGAALFLAYKKISWFRNGVNAVFRAVAAAGKWLWDVVLRPVFSAMGNFISGVWRTRIWPVLRAFWLYLRNTVGPAVMGFYRNHIVPAWNGIRRAIAAAWPVIRGIFNSFKAGLRVAGSVVSWLWRNAVVPAWNGIRRAVAVAWPVIRGVLNSLKVGLKAAGAVVSWLWKNAVIPAWNGIRRAVAVGWAGIRVIFNAIKVGLQAAGRIFSWLWKNIAIPAWNGIKSAIGVAWAGIKIVFAAFKVGLQAAGRIVSWLWKNIVIPAWNGIKTAISVAWGAIRVIFNAVKSGLQAAGRIFTWLWKNAVIPAWNGIKTVIANAWAGIKKTWDVLMDVVKNKIPAAFRAARDTIGKIWDGIKGLVAKPINVVIGFYNDSLRGFVGKALSAVGISKNPLPAVSKIGGYKDGGVIPGYAGGGVLPGYSPGRDNMLASSPRGPVALAGGEGILRPEVMKTPGVTEFLHTANHAARKGGKAGVRGALGFSDGGVMPGGRPVASFDDGGVFGWIKNAAKTGLGMAASTIPGLNLAKGITKDGILSKGVLALWEKLGGKAFQKVIDAIAAKGGAIGDVIGGSVKNVVEKIMGWLVGKTAPAMGGDGDVTWSNASERLTKALNWARTQDGKPYQWGGGGNPSWDCSGFMAGIENVIRGLTPGRRYTTHDFIGGSNAPSGWVENLQSPFMVGVTHGGVGHMAGTLLGVNVESAGGGKGVHVGSAARGATNSLFGKRYGFSPVKNEAKPGGSGKKDGDQNKSSWFAGISAGGSGGGRGSLSGIVSGRTSFTWYGGPADSQDNSKQASGIPHHAGSISSPYWPIGTKVTMKNGRFQTQGTVEEFGPAAWAIAQHSPPAIIDVGYLTKPLIGGGDGVADFAVNSWGSGRSYRRGGPGWELAGGSRIPSRKDGGVIPGYATGGLTRAGELAWVGERGPELVRFGGPSQVWDAETSKRMNTRRAGGYAKGTKGKKKPTSMAAKNAALAELLEDGSIAEIRKALGMTPKKPKKKTPAQAKAAKAERLKRRNLDLREKLREKEAASTQPLAERQAAGLKLNFKSLQAAFASGASGAASAAAKLTKSITENFGKKSEKSLIGKVNKAVAALNAQFAKIDLYKAQQAKATAAGTALTNSSKEYMSLGSSGNLGDVGSIVEDQKFRQSQTKAFATNLQKLKGKGYSQSVLDQMYGMDYDAASQYATTLMSGSAAQVKALNASQVSSASISASLGAAAAASYAGSAGWMTAKQLAAAQKKAEALAKGITKTIAPNYGLTGKGDKKPVHKTTHRLKPTKTTTSKRIKKKKYDVGGDMRPGLNVAWNETGKTESVVTAPWREQLARDIADIKAKAAGDKEVNMTVVFQHPVDAYTATRELANRVADALNGG